MDLARFSAWKRGTRGGLVWELLAALGAVAFLLTAAFGLYLYSERENLRARLISANEARLSLAYDAVGRELDLVRSHMRYLAGSRLAARFLDAGGERERAEIERDWVQFAGSVDLYDQLRLLDLSGREALRINHAPDNKPAAVTASELQDKSDRYYFRDAVGLSPGELYLSPFDLNIEGTGIELPYKPTLRFAAPIWQDGRLRGVLVLNYRGRRMINAARAQIESQAERLMLLNAQGYWLAAPDPGDEWGFMLGNQRTMEKRNPGLWSQMRSARSGRYEDGSGIYLYRTIYPLVASEISTTGAPLHEARGAGKVSPDEYSWMLVSWIPPQALEDRYAPTRRNASWLFLAALGLALPLTGYGAAVRARNLAAQRDLQLAGQVFEATGDAVLVTDREFRIIRINPAFAALTGWPLAEIAGRDPETLLSPARTEPGLCARLRAELASGGWQGMLWFRRSDGGEFPAWASVGQVADPDGAIRNCVLVFNDITDRVREEDRVRTLAERDALTGLPNRRLLLDRLQQSVAHARRSGAGLAVLFIDLDRFKQVNDEGGHDAGDAVLQATAQRLDAAMRASDTAARLGGDEFVVVLGEIADRAAAQAVARKLVSVIEQPVEFKNRVYSVGASIGVKLFPEDGESAETLLRAADEEMYSVKAQGRPAK